MHARSSSGSEGKNGVSLRRSAGGVALRRPVKSFSVCDRLDASERSGRRRRTQADRRIDKSAPRATCRGSVSASGVVPALRIGNAATSESRDHHGELSDKEPAPYGWNNTKSRPRSALSPRISSKKALRKRHTGFSFRKKSATPDGSSTGNRRPTTAAVLPNLRGI